MVGRQHGGDPASALYVDVAPVPVANSYDMPLAAANAEEYAEVLDVEGGGNYSVPTMAPSGIPVASSGDMSLAAAANTANAITYDYAGSPVTVVKREGHNYRDAATVERQGYRVPTAN